MKLDARLLGRFVDGLPAERSALRALLDDIGVEVKRADGDDFTLELLANRGDHYCYHGVAREISGRTGASVRMPPCATLEVGTPPLPLRNETNNSLVYTATAMERVRGGSLGVDALAPLLAAGGQTLGAPIDATNLSNLEIGQPTHVFDAATIVGGIVIRESRPGETCRPLFSEQPVPVPEGAVVIADEVKVLAVAGVIGCEESKVTDTTTRLVLESATFDPVSVRKTSRAMGIHTDSSARFERGGDPSLPLVGAGRVVHLLETEGGWRRVGATGLVGDWADPDRRIALSVEATNAFLEMGLSADEIRARLERYGFAVTGDGRTLTVRVPPHRLWDVHHVQDLYEEVAKSVGYNATPTSLPPVAIGALPSRAEERRARVDTVLCSFGFFEVVTDGFYGPGVRERLGLTPQSPLWPHVETLNSLDRGTSLLKNNALAQAVETVAKAVHRKHDEVKAFEWTRCFLPNPEADNGVCSERPVLWAIASGHDRVPSWAKDARGVDVHSLAALVREIGVATGVALGLADSAETRLPPHLPAFALHPTRQRALVHRGIVVGLIGEVHPTVVRAFGLKRVRPVYLELEADLVLEGASEPKAYAEPPDWQPVERNLAFTLPHGLESSVVIAVMRRCGPAGLDRIEVVDEYRHEDAGKEVRTLTFALRFANPTHDLLAEDVNRSCELVVRAVQESLGVKLRS